MKKRLDDFVIRFGKMGRFHGLELSQATKRQNIALTIAMKLKNNTVFWGGGRSVEWVLVYKLAKGRSRPSKRRSEIYNGRLTLSFGSNSNLTRDRARMTPKSPKPMVQA